MIHRLGGFARLGLVLAVLWTALIAWLALETMPEPAPDSALVTALEQSAERPSVWDPKTKQLLTTAEAERQVRDARADMTERERAAIDASAALSDRLRSPKTQDKMIYLEGRGFIRLEPGQTVQDVIAQHPPDLSDKELLELLTVSGLTASDLDKLTDGERARLRNLHQNAVRDQDARRSAHTRSFLAYWLLPIAGVFASAHTIRWVYRGFSQRADSPKG